MQVTTT